MAVKELFVCNVDSTDKLLALIRFLKFRLMRKKSTRVQVLVDMDDHQIKLIDSAKEGKVGTALPQGESGSTT